MTTLRNLLVAILVLVIPMLAGASSLDMIHLRMVEGDVQIKMADSEEWVPAASNMPLYQGDKLWVPDDAKAELQLTGGTSVRLGANTALELLSAATGDYQLYLDEGYVYVNYREPGTTTFTINTPIAALRADRPSIFRVDARDAGPATISVLKGSVYTARESGEIKVNAGERIVQRDPSSPPELTRLAAADQWERWNRQRDEDVYGRRGQSTTYLPDELRPYSSDFDTNGRWENTPDYGYVWTPTIVVQDWSPYQAGRWVWMQGDYVWVSYEPWGWVPYHYGRWAHIQGRGWSWVPPNRGEVYWAPGYVGWVYTPTYVAWVPLAPREVYYGRGYHGPHSVNITQINVQTTVIKNVYVNVKVANAVTTLQRDAFLSGRHTPTRVRENPFLGARPAVGSPQFKPARPMMPVVKDIPAAKLPPQKIRQTEHFAPKGPGFRIMPVKPVPGEAARPGMGRGPEQRGKPVVPEKAPPPARVLPQEKPGRQVPQEGQQPESLQKKPGPVQPRPAVKPPVQEQPKEGVENKGAPIERPGLGETKPQQRLGQPEQRGKPVVPEKAPPPARVLPQEKPGRQVPQEGQQPESLQKKPGPVQPRPAVKPPMEEMKAREVGPAGSTGAKGDGSKPVQERRVIQTKPPQGRATEAPAERPAANQKGEAKEKPEKKGPEKKGEKPVPAEKEQPEARPQRPDRPER